MNAPTDRKRKNNEKTKDDGSQKFLKDGIEFYIAHSRSTHRADGHLDGGHLRRDGLYQRAGKGQRHDTRRNTGFHCRARRTGPGRRAVADAQKAARPGV